MQHIFSPNSIYKQLSMQNDFCYFCESMATSFFQTFFLPFRLWTHWQIGLFFISASSAPSNMSPTWCIPIHVCVGYQGDHVVQKQCASQCMVISHWGQVLRCPGTRVSIWLWRGCLKISLPYLAGMFCPFLQCISLTHYCISLQEHTPWLSLWINKCLTPISLVIRLHCCWSLKLNFRKWEVNVKDIFLFWHNATKIFSNKFIQSLN